MRAVSKGILNKRKRTEVCVTGECELDRSNRGSVGKSGQMKGGSRSGGSCKDCNWDRAEVQIRIAALGIEAFGPTSENNSDLS